MSETSQKPGNKPAANPFEQWIVPKTAEEERVAIETLLAESPFQPPKKQQEILQKAVEETQRCAYRFLRENNGLASQYFQKWHDSLEKKLIASPPKL